ncbi:MAG: hypothetical protein HY000_38385 [Planctomycetes bacterium]|nr:hypothetical protein [Planctomycetota bacterium]
MTYRGHVENGVVVLDEPCDLPDGAAVQVSPIPPPAGAKEGEIPSLYERLRPFVGAAKGLPRDLSVNHDHYLYGAPRRQ